MATPRDIERRLDAVDAKLPTPRDAVLAELDWWLATLSNDGLEWLEHEFRQRADADPTGVPTDEEWRAMAEIAVAISEERCCAIGSDPVSRWNWRWRYWKPGDPLPRAKIGVAPDPVLAPAPRPARREVAPATRARS